MLHSVKLATPPDNSGQAVWCEVSVGWRVPVQVVGLEAGVSFCCAYLELSTLHVNRGNAEAEKSTSASPIISAYSDIQVSFT